MSQDYKQKLLFLFTKLEDDGNYGCIVRNNVNGRITSNSKLSIKSELENGRICISKLN